MILEDTARTPTFCGQVKEDLEEQQRPGGCAQAEDGGYSSQESLGATGDAVQCSRQLSSVTRGSGRGTLPPGTDAPAWTPAPALGHG